MEVIAKSPLKKKGGGEGLTCETGREGERGREREMEIETQTGKQKDRGGQTVRRTENYNYGMSDMKTT